MKKMLEFDYVSDLHLGFYVNYDYNQDKLREKVRRFIDEMLPIYKAPYFILAGDISEYNIYTFIVLEELSLNYDHVFYVFGNHDYYLISNTQVQKYGRDSMNRVKEVKEKYKNHPKIHVLDNDIYELEGNNIFGSTSWYDVSRPADLFWWMGNSNDSKMIYPKGELEMLGRFFRDKEEYDQLEGKEIDLIISHVPPIHFPTNMHPLSASYTNERINFYHSKHWVCGHQHSPCEVEYNGTRFYNNAWGYPGEVRDKKIRRVRVY